MQEYRSEQSLHALTKLLPPHATCLRSGKVTCCSQFEAQDVVGEPAIEMMLPLCKSVLQEERRTYIIKTDHVMQLVYSGLDAALP